MKILQICSARIIGGGEKHLVDLANGLHARGHEVFLAMRPDSGLRAELQALPERNILALRTQGPLNILNAFNLAQFTREHKIDVIHAHIAHDYLLAAFTAKLAGRGKLISPSRSEPFGLSIIEGMACGVPVIATSSEGALEILEDGVTGQLLRSNNPEELASAILRLLDDEERRRSLSAQALKLVHNKFAVESMVIETEQLYEKLFSKRDQNGAN